MATKTDSTKLTPTARMPDSEPPLGSFLPKNRMTTYDSAGSSGISHAFSARPADPAACVTASVARNISALHEVDLVQVDGDPVAVDEQDDGQAHTDLGRGDGDHEE